MDGEFWFFGGVAALIGVFWGLTHLITKRQDSPSRCYPNQDESSPGCGP